jgi:DNA segregation ATPase FtsK/SpoIIIE-like protein
MHPQASEFDLLKLRRQLEEILAMVKADHNAAAFNLSVEEKEPVFPVQHETDVTAVEPAVALVDECSEPETVFAPVPSVVVVQPDERDDLYDDALVVLTEFGHASPAVLQMWLSIDYSRAITILNRFQVDGLISSKGRVRHKAFLQRRSLEQQA